MKKVIIILTAVAISGTAMAQIHDITVTKNNDATARGMSSGKVSMQDISGVVPTATKPGTGTLVLTSGNLVPGKNKIALPEGKGYMTVELENVLISSMTTTDKNGKTTGLTKVGAGTLQYSSADKSINVVLTKTGATSYSIKMTCTATPASDGRSYVTGY